MANWSAPATASLEIDDDLRIVVWSAEAERLWGWSAADVVGTSVSRLVPTRNRDRQRRYLETRFGSSLTLPGHATTGLHRDSREFRAHVSEMPSSDGRLHIIAQGMSPAEWAHATFDATEPRFRSILDQISDAYSLVDLWGNLLFVNASYCRLYGFAKDAVLGTNFRDQFGSRWTPAVMTAIQEVHAGVYRTGEPVDGFEFDVLRGGETIRVEMTVSLDRNASGDPVGFNGISRDCTRRALAEREAAGAREAAEAASRSKSEFLANMSHEIRTPMNGVIGMTELALSTPLSDVQRDYLSTAHGSAEALLVIINDILDLSKVEAGKLELESVSFSLRTLIDDSIRPLAFRAHQKGLELLVDVRPGAADSLIGDPHRLRQVIVNLVSNAIKFTAEGEILVAVSSSPVDGEAVTLTVRVNDTGVGIPEEQRATIFQAFTQADSSTTRRFGGTGLGLTISSQLLTLMGGRISVESKPGVGSAFEFDLTLPLSRTIVVPTHPFRVEDLAGHVALVVDDNATNRRILTETLTRWGLEVIAAADAAGAEAAVDKRGLPFTLALIDMNLAGVSGFDVAATLRTYGRCASTSLLMMTSSDHPGESNDVATLTNARYVVKPVGESVLLQNVLAALGARATTATQPAAPQITPIRAADRLKVLVAEDNPVNSKLADHLLRRRGHEPVLVPNGREAVAALVHGGYDLVLMDLQMPEMDGFEATSLIRGMEKETGQRVPIVALTAHAMEDDRQRCLDADMDGYVSKPIRPVELFEVIDRVMAARCAHVRR